MIIGSLAIFLHLCVIALMAASSTMVLLCLVWPFAQKRLHYFSLTTRKTLLWSYVSAPWTVAFMMLLLFIPTFTYQTDLWLSTVAHWHHPELYNIQSWYGPLPFFFAFAVAVFAKRTQHKWSAVRSRIKTLTSLSQGKTETLFDREVCLIDSEQVSAFTSGIVTPTCYLTTGLKQHLSDDELKMVIEHEYAHIRSKDTFFKSLFSLLAAFYPKKVELSIRSQHTLLTELAADRHVANNFGQENVAATLVKIAKIQRAEALLSPQPTVSFFAEHHHLTTRVKQLLSPIAPRPFAKSILVATTLILLCLSFFAVDSMHHSIELFFSH